MERNWLIRTTQNKILGPVSKAKVLEFFEKGALGLSDEVMCGNGHWFSLKEKILVERYLLGDIPQEFNPISETKSVLYKRENPDKTASINASPMNGVGTRKDDFQFPDITLINKDVKALLKKNNAEEIRIPKNEDLEFPDLSLIEDSIKSTPLIPVDHSEPIEIKSTSNKEEELILDDTSAIYPESTDLDYPDLQIEPAPEVIQEVIKEKEKRQEVPRASEQKILLHERKIKASQKALSQVENTKEHPKKQERSALPEHLKKQNDNYLVYVLIILILIIVSLFFYYYNTILNKPLLV